jgi:hypothetical protein
MHYAQSLVQTLGAEGGFLDRPCSTAEALRIDSLLQIDASNYLYSACVSIGDALQGLEKSLFTWSTVKLYYSTFYLLRALLALSGRALVYDGYKPRTLLCKAGENPGALGGKIRGTHQLVIAYFEKSFPSSPLLSQDIANERPFEWLINRREEANYAAGRFEDPSCPPHFGSVVRVGVRKATAGYIADHTYLYAFDPDHAMLAFPIEVLKATLAHPRINLVSNTGIDSQRFFRSIFADRSGPLVDIIALLKV